MRKPLVLIAALVVVLGRAEAQNEPFRPQFHFTPRQNWMNDPNGLVFYGGEWHLFYQHNPFGNKWGHMSWGHAVSRDLMHWTHLPLALAEENGVMIFSGSAVVDWKNTSGLGINGKPPLIAIYTGHREGRQDQRIAFSNDRGRTWTKVPGSVLDLQMADFRDPKVFWHAKSSRWIMAVALPNEHVVRFYASPNLRQWTMVGSFGPAGATGGQWECPDLFPVAVEGGGTRWVLIVNINPGGITGGSGSQYFTGDFDGSRFTADASGGATLWADYGSDFYAGVSWADVPARDGRRVWLGWMSNWLYGQDVPTSPWRSAMTVPRALTLRRTPAGLRLVQTPVRELESLRQAKARRFHGGSISEANAWLAAQGNLPSLLDVELTFTGVRDVSPFSVRLATAVNEGSTIAIDPARRQLTVDRSQSGQIAFHPAFSLRHVAPLRIIDGKVRLRLLLDASSLEIFAQRGETVLTELIFPHAGSRQLLIDATGDGPRVGEITIHPLTSAQASFESK